MEWRTKDARAAGVGRTRRSSPTAGRTDGRRRTVGPEPGRAGRQCPPGGVVQAARPRPPDTGCSSPAEGQRRKGAGSDCQIARGAPRAPSPAHLRVYFTQQVPGAQTHLLLQGAAGARARAGAGARAGAVLAVRLQVAHGAGGGVGVARGRERGGLARRPAPARRWEGAR